MTSTSVRRAAENRWARFAVLTIVPMLGYFVVDNHVPLYPWNDLERAKPQLPSTLSGLLPFTVAAVALSRRWLPAMIFFAGYAYVWLGIQLWNWWVPYLFGGERDFAGEYERTLHPLPEIAGRPGPDAEHLVLQALSLLMAVAMTAAVVRERRLRRDRTADAVTRPSGAASPSR